MIFPQPLPSAVAFGTPGTALETYRPERTRPEQTPAPIPAVGWDGQRMGERRLELCHLTTVTL